MLRSCSGPTLQPSRRDAGKDGGMTFCDPEAVTAPASTGVGMPMNGGAKSAYSSVHMSTGLEQLKQEFSPTSVESKEMDSTTQRGRSVLVIGRLHPLDITTVTTVGSLSSFNLHDYPIYIL